MSKKVLWVWSFNNHQQTVGTPAGMSGVTLHPIKFQKAMRKTLAPEWAFEFISDDFSEELPKADVIVIPKTNKALYAERAKNAKVVWVSGIEVAEHNYEGIKHKIINA
ncbi:hypothetical protein KQI58_16610 [Enterococcus raffinosus]|uniref:hypothetical protein n=1 Tax=Enterococcus raffinosus TaxID=71452 RepID=UPI001C104F9A|nr:hypothetical protein [Enterococcus raffinosus]MBU5362693.1 hypothetical protein [Enterococcus raffinosus]